MELGEVVHAIGLGIAASGLGGIAINPHKPRYLMASLLTIPSAFVLSQHVPQSIGQTIAGAYAGSLLGYGAARIFSGPMSTKSEGITSGIGAAIGAAATYAALTYL